MFCLESTCEIAVVGRAVFTKVCDESIYGWRTLFDGGTHRMIHWKGHSF